MNNTLDTLPINVMHYILSYVDLEDISNVELVNKRCYTMVDSLLKSIAQKNAPVLVPESCNTLKKIGSFTEGTNITMLKTCGDLAYLVTNDGCTLEVKKKGKDKWDQVKWEQIGLINVESGQKIKAIDCTENKFFIVSVNEEINSRVIDLYEISNDKKAPLHLIESFKFFDDIINAESVWFFNSNQILNIKDRKIYELNFLNLSISLKINMSQFQGDQNIPALTRYDDHCCYFWKATRIGHKYLSIFDSSIKQINSESDNFYITETSRDFFNEKIEENEKLLWRNLCWDDFQVMDRHLFILSKNSLHIKFIEFPVDQPVTKRAKDAIVGMPIVPVEKSLGFPKINILDSVKSFTLDKSNKTLSVIDCSGQASIYELPCEIFEDKRKVRKLFHQIVLKSIGQQFLSEPEKALMSFQKLPKNVKNKGYEIVYKGIKQFMKIHSSNFLQDAEDAFLHTKGTEWACNQPKLNDNYRYLALKDLAKAFGNK